MVAGFSEDDIDLCTEDTGKDVDLYVSSELRTMVEVREGDRTLKVALDEEHITAIGNRHLIRSMNDWFGFCAFADIRPAEKDVA